MTDIFEDLKKRQETPGCTCVLNEDGGGNLSIDNGSWDKGGDMYCPHHQYPFDDDESEASE